MKIREIRYLNCLINIHATKGRSSFHQVTIRKLVCELKGGGGGEGEGGERERERERRGGEGERERRGGRGERVVPSYRCQRGPSFLHL